MFETSVVQVRAQSGARLSLLSVSVIAHSAVVIGAIAMSIASTEFPTNAPKAFELAPVFRMPPPLGTLGGSSRPPEPKPPQPQQKQPAAPVQPNEVTAPQTVPDTIQNAKPAASALPSSTPGTGDSSVVSNGPGVPWGTKGATGDLDAPPGPLATAEPEPEKIYEVHEVKAPVPLYKPDPQYPPHLVRTRMPATVVVRCIIDKNGHVRDPRLVQSGLPPFNKAVLDVISTWRYTPGSRNGVAVETYLDVTVRFGVN
ncbi:MAG TPA: TonB family protein [Thermoanaerobaculia bacterium]|jgi:protein TonB